MQNSVFAGIILMIIDSASLSATYTSCKFAILSMSSDKAVFFYRFVIFFSILPWVFRRLDLSMIKTSNLKLHIARGIMGTLGSLFMIKSFAYMKLVDATAISQFEQILWIVCGSLFFNEKINLTKVIAVIFGFLGVFLIIKFNNNANVESNISINIKGYIYILLCVTCFVINSTLVKFLGKKKEKNEAQLFYIMLFSSIFSYFVAFTDLHFNGTTIDLTLMKPDFYHVIYSGSLIFILLAALFYLIHSVVFFYSMKVGEMSAVAPFCYFKTIFSGIYGYIFFSELPTSIGSYIGYTMIIIGGVITLTSIKFNKLNVSKNTIY